MKEVYNKRRKRKIGEENNTRRVIKEKERRCVQLMTRKNDREKEIFEDQGKGERRS